MRIFLTGCQGYLGGVLGPRLRAAGHDVQLVATAVDNVDGVDGMDSTRAPAVRCRDFPGSPSASSGGKGAWWRVEVFMCCRYTREKLELPRRFTQ